MSASTSMGTCAFTADNLLGAFAEAMSPEDVNSVREFAAREEPADHWLRSGKLSYEQRIVLGAAAVMALRSPLGTPYKCAVFMRHAAESLAR